MSLYTDKIELALKIAEQYISAARVANEMGARRSAVGGHELNSESERLFAQGVNILEKTREELK